MMPEPITDPAALASHHNEGKIAANSPRALVLLFIALILIVPLIGLAVIKLYAPEVKRETFANLEAIASLKSHQIENWLAERNGNSNAAMTDDTLAEQVGRMVHSGIRAADDNRIRNYLNRQRMAYDYAGILLLSADGVLLMSSGQHIESNLDIAGKVRRMTSGKVLRNGPYRNQNGRIYMDWMVPISNSAQPDAHPVAALLFRVDIDQFLYPLIQTWPTASPSGETLLISKQGEYALFLNNLRHRKGTALTLSPSLATPGLLAVAAIRANAPGTAEGVDYRDIPVIGAFRPVSGTDWLIVAKLDHDEVFAPLNTLIFWVALIAFVAALALCASMLLVWRQQQRAQDLALLAQHAEAGLKLHRLDDSVRESRARAQMLIDSALDAVISIDSDGRVIDWNAQAESIFGYSCEYAEGREMASLIIPVAQRDAHRNGIARFVRTGKVNLIGKRVEVTGLRSDGSEFPMELTISTLFQNGKYVFSAYARDIGSRKMAESELRQSVQWFASIFNSSPIAVSIATADDGRFIHVNRNYERDFGWSVDDLTGKTSVEVGFWPDEAARAEWTQTLLVSGRLIDYESCWPKKNGESRIVSISAEIADLDGKSCILAYVTDITDRKEAEDRIRKLSMAVEQSPESIAITSLDGELEYVNEAFVRTTGYTMEEAIGQNARILRSPGTPSKTYVELWDALNQGKSWDGEFHNRRKDGSIFIEFAHITPIRQPDGRITSYMALKEDITEKKRLNEELDQHRNHLKDLVTSRTEQLAEARERAETASRAKSAFLANMSHEIRTPLNAIAGLTHLLSRADPTPEQAERLTKIDGAASHLLSILNDILDISKIEAGRLELEYTDFHLGILLDNIHSLIADQARVKGLQVRVDPDSMPLWLRGDPTRLRQALLNYASNAIKFTDSGSVSVRARLLQELPDELHLRFEVEDTGIGIPADKMDSLFQAFEQADVSTTRKYGGTGLGLAITRRLAGLMGGETGVESKQGNGSTFWFTVRLKRGQGVMPNLACPDNNVAEAELKRHSGARILLVDDVAINREVARELLEGTGLLIDTAENGRQAVEKARLNSYSLILMDVQMPVMDGLEATRMIHRMPGHARTPVLALTANAFDEDRRICLDAGMIDFVSKPVDPGTLYATLLKWLTKPDPAAKVETGSEQTKPTSAAKSGLSPVGTNLPGLDIESGLLLWRKPDVYRKFLQKFAAEYSASVRTMQQAVAVNGVGTAAALAHKLKGAAANLALTEIARHTADIERKLKAGGNAATELIHLQQILDTAINSILIYAPVITGSAARPGSNDAAQVTPLLKAFLHALDTDNPDRAEPLLHQLTCLLLPEQLQLIRATLDDFDFRGAESATRELAATLCVSLDMPDLMQ